MGGREIGKERLGEFKRQLGREERELGTIEKYMREVKKFALWQGRRKVTKETVSEWKEQ
ncbi:MAG: integrase, partial [Oscillospiraceae bacterium]|nr:integrase [Oscillospiraceae bacterium]